jgi:hypothetical protein
MEVDEFLARWPWCYHVTARRNLAGIARRGCLLSANDLLVDAQSPDLSCVRRTTDLVLSVRGLPAILRNQSTLDPNTIRLVGGISLADYVYYLNSRVFLWPGDRDRPSEGCLRMLTSTGGQLVIRMRMQTLLESNSGRVPHLSFCNAGATWAACELTSVRSDAVFSPIDCFAGAADEIIEISYPQSVRLPPRCQSSTVACGPWLNITPT